MQAKKIMEQYFNLPFVGVNAVRCPYFNNARTGKRGQLRVLSGKGTPAEIVEETKIISLQYHAGLFDATGHCCLHADHGHEKNAEHIRKFLIDHNLGVDCSGFVTQILAAHYAETKHVNLPRQLSKNPANILRSIINHLRPIENIGVRTYFDDTNTTSVPTVAELKPLDLVVMMQAGGQNQRNHILLITKIENCTISYTHATSWGSDGLYGHGVSKGEIIITDPTRKLLDQRWTERNKTNEQNETYLEAKSAKILQIRRLNF